MVSSFVHFKNVKKKKKTCCLCTWSLVKSALFVILFFKRTGKNPNEEIFKAVVCRYYVLSSATPWSWLFLTSNIWVFNAICFIGCQPRLRILSFFEISQALWLGKSHVYLSLLLLHNLKKSVSIIYCAFINFKCFECWSAALFLCLFWHYLNAK